MTTKPPSASALDRLRSYIEAEVAAGLANLGAYRGNHLAAITQSEQEVFHLEMLDIPRLAAVYLAWEAACGIISDELAGDPGLTAAVRAELEPVQRGRMLLPKDATHTDFIAAWTDFAKLFGLPHRPAYVFFWKNHFLDMRSGLIDYDDGYHGPDFRAVAHDDEEELPF